MVPKARRLVPRRCLRGGNHSRIQGGRVSKLLSPKRKPAEVPGDLPSGVLWSSPEARPLGRSSKPTSLPERGVVGGQGSKPVRPSPEAESIAVTVASSLTSSGSSPDGVSKSPLLMEDESRSPKIPEEVSLSFVMALVPAILLC